MTTFYAPDVFIKDKVEALASTLGLDLPHQEQWDFVQSTISQDLQAAPGSGKTSLISLKLALLAQGWLSPTRGVCVLSHTNTAKDEITARLAATPAGRRLLQYPHFIGTIQAFAHTFLALPALRARGVEVRAIDDQVYEAEALRLLDRHPAYSTLSSFLKRRRDGRQLVAEAHYVCDAGELKVTGPGGSLPFGPEKLSGRQFSALKEQLISQGVLRYRDMFAIAEHHLLHHPYLAQAIAYRFPFVLLDEMQDTSDLQQHLLDRVFGADGTVVQRVGDVNQRIFTDSAAGGTRPSSFPQPLAPELPVSRRFGTQIADFASDLTLHRPQRINGAGPDGMIALLLFDDDSVTEVVPVFERMAAAVVPRDLLLNNPPRVLGARLKPGAAKTHPQSLACYIPDFAASTMSQAAGSLITATRDAQARWRSGDSHAAVTHLWNAVRTVLQPSAQGSLPPLRRLERGPQTAGRRARLLLHDFLTAPLDDQVAWETLRKRLLQVASELTQASLKGVAQLAQPLSYTPPAPLPARHPETSTEVQREAVASVAGSIQSAKGETHTATLILECLDSKGRKHDVHEVLSLLSREEDPRRASVTIQRAAQLVFVGATRPTHLLALATHQRRAEPHIDALAARGWTIRDVTAPW